MIDAAPLIEKIDTLENTLLKKQRRIEVLEETIRLMKQRHFGTSSEKVSPDQLGLFNEAEATEGDDLPSDVENKTTEVKGHTRTSRPRVSIPDDLPCEDIIYDLPAEEKVCLKDGTELKAIGFDDHKQLEIIPADVKVIRHRRVKYICPCCEQHMATAKKPALPIEKSIAGPSLLAYVVIQKFCDALPLYRQSQIFERFGIALDRSNLANWMIKCGELIQPLINLLNDYLEQQPIVHVDETTVQVLKELGKTPESKSYMWVRASQVTHPVILYHYAPTRAQSVPQALLNENYRAIMVDGYKGYQKACDEYDIVRLGCWQHARHRFVEVKKLTKTGKTGRVDQALAYFQKLYRVEDKIKDKPPDKRYEIRQKEAKPITEKLRSWLDKNLTHVPPSSALGKAMHYLNNQWDRLVRYLDDGYYPIDNNYCERSIRPFTIGRKNWIFANSVAGAKASAHLYSIVQTAKANELNLFEYLTQVFKELPNAQNVGDIEKLLPWNYKQVMQETK